MIVDFLLSLLDILTVNLGLILALVIEGSIGTCRNITLFDLQLHLLETGGVKKAHEFFHLALLNNPVFRCIKRLNEIIDLKVVNAKSLNALTREELFNELSDFKRVQGATFILIMFGPNCLDVILSIEPSP